MLLNEIANRLTSTGVAVGKVPGSTSTLAWTVFESMMPSSPDKAIAVIEATGRAPFGRFSMTQPSLLVRVRGAPIDESTSAYNDARAQAEAVDAALHAMAPGTLSPAYYAGVWALSEPYPIGPDENLRPEFAQRFRALRVST
jgi:hypothetical protein